MEKSDTLNLILAFSCILLSKKKTKTKCNATTTLYASLISSSKQVSAVCVELGGVGTGYFTKKYAQIKS